MRNACLIIFLAIGALLLSTYRTNDIQTYAKFIGDPNNLVIENNRNISVNAFKEIPKQSLSASQDYIHQRTNDLLAYNMFVFALCFILFSIIWKVHRIK